MKFTIVVLAFLFLPTSIFGQFKIFKRYSDFPGAAIRRKETRTVNKVKEKSFLTVNAYNSTLATSAVEKFSKTNLNFNLNSSNTAKINYIDYKDVCKSYLNPFERSACNNKLNYLIEAHSQVLYLMQSSTTYQINTGVKELIMQKYTHITNRILLELETMKIESEQTWYHLVIN
jgi:hypothetical protein